MIDKEMLPEEKVRQQLLEFMQKHLEYPKEMIAIEKSLSAFPHLQGQKVSNRRVDIAVFSKKQMEPLLVIECKAVPINDKAFDQIIGYNHLIKAPFIALANQKGVITLIHDGKCYQRFDGLPDYNYLLENLPGGGLC
jgi:hypothetical protein